MRYKIRMMVAVFMLIPGMMFMMSCAKNRVDSGEMGGSSYTTDRDAAAEAARQRELQRQKSIEEETLQSQRESAMQEKQRALNRFINEDVLYDFDEASLQPKAQRILRNKAKYLKENPGVSVIIEGHCDEQGTNDYNIALGDRRANSAKAFLMDLGINASRMRTISYGEEKPLDPGHNETAWAKNRRGHFVIK
jgi:peptidoglycan-associated lipoprotein